MARGLTKTVVLLAILASVSWLAWRAWTMQLVDTRFFSGWSLFVIVVLLMLLSARKTLPFLPIGSVSGWLNFHIFVGLFAGFVFLLHIGFRLPHGYVDNVLAAVFLVAFFTGILGLFLTRSIPPKLAAGGNVLLRDQIPTVVRRIAGEVDDLVIRSVVESNSEIIPHLHCAYLKQYFATLGTGRAGYFPNPKVYASLATRIDELGRFAGPAEQELLEQISSRVDQKRELDLQYSRQTLLKSWLLVHVPLSYSLLFLMVAHAATRYIFRGTVF